MVRKVLGAVAGLAVGCVMIFLVQLISMMIHPMAPIAEGDKEALRRHVENAPLSAMLVVLASHAIGPMCGGATAARIGRAWTPVAIVGVFFELVGVYTITQIPGHPLWFSVASLSTFLPAALIGGMLAMPKAKASGGR